MARIYPNARNYTPSAEMGIAIAAAAEADAKAAAPDASVPFIASRGELGAPAPVEHPLPWRWFESRERPGTFMALQDARGANLINGWMEVASPRVRAMTEAAPEMADELRWLVDNSVPTWDERGTHRDRWVALLARIDAAGKRR